jgi:hypothetical protein
MLQIWTNARTGLLKEVESSQNFGVEILMMIMMMMMMMTIITTPSGSPYSVASHDT